MEIMPNTLVKRGEVVFREGDKADGVYYLCTGKMKVTRAGKFAEQVVAELEEGDIFGELAMVDQRKRSATITAIEDSWLYKFSAQAFQRKMSEADPLLQSVITTLVLTVRNLHLKQERLEGELPRE